MVASATHLIIQICWTELSGTTNWDRGASKLMKGPFERLKYEMRRIWECPVCRRHERTDGGISSLFCQCQRDVDAAERRCMKLLANGIRRAGSLEAESPQE